MASAGTPYRGKAALRIAEPVAQSNARVYLELLKNDNEADVIRILRPDGRQQRCFQQGNSPSRKLRVAKAAWRRISLAHCCCAPQIRNVADYAV